MNRILDVGGVRWDIEMRNLEFLIKNSKKSHFRFKNFSFLTSKIPNMNQKGFSPLVLLFLVVLGAFILWELNESISFYNLDLQNRPQNITATKPKPVCLTGILDDCNDSNDVFLLPD